MEHDKIFVGSLSSSTTQNDLEEAFSKYGSINEIKLIKDRFTGESKGFAFIKYSSNAYASKALEMNGQYLDGQTIRVSHAQKKESFKDTRRHW